MELENELRVPVVARELTSRLEDMRLVTYLCWISFFLPCFDAVERLNNELGSVEEVKTHSVSAAVPAPQHLI